MAISNLCKRFIFDLLLGTLIFFLLSAQNAKAWSPDGSTAYQGRLFTPPDNALNESVVFFATAQSWMASDWTHVSGLAGDWKSLYSPRQGSNLAFSKSQAEIGFLNKDWGFSYKQRSDVSVVANRDLLDLLYVQKNNLSPPIASVYHPQIQIRSLSAQGPHLTKRFSLLSQEDTRLTAVIGVGFLMGHSMRYAEMQGMTQRTSSNEFSLIVPVLSDIDSNKVYPFMANGNPSGTGYGVDVAMFAKWLGSHQAWFLIDDWQTRIQWKQVPSTRAVADSRTVSLGSDGYLAYAPAIQGSNARTDTTQRIDPTITLGYARELGVVTLSFEALRVSGANIPRASFAYRASENLRLFAGKDFRLESTYGGVQWNNWAVSMSSNRLNLSNSKAYALSLRYQKNLPTP
jgi:hypothetical protein